LRDEELIFADEQLILHDEELIFEPFRLSSPPETAGMRVKAASGVTCSGAI